MTRLSRFLILPVLLLLAVAAHGQTVLSGTVVDPNAVPYRNGTITAYVPGDTVVTFGPFPTDNSGAFSFTIHSQVWYFKVCTPAIVAVPPNPVPYGTVCFTAGPITISGGSQSITTQLNAAAVPINPGGVTGVTSFNTRSGAVVPATNDYSEASLSFTDITTNNVSTTKHGFAPKLPNDATKYLDGTGGYTVPPGSGGGCAPAGTINFLVLDNGAGGCTTDPLWNIASGVLQAQDDTAEFQLFASDGNKGITFSLDHSGNADFQVTDSAGSSVDINSANGIVPSGLPIDLSNANAGTFPDIIDSTGSHGNAGALFTSLGSGNGVKWDPIWVDDSVGNLTATNDSAFIDAISTDTTADCSVGPFGMACTDATNTLQWNPEALTMGTADIIDSGNSHGSPGYGLISLGTGSGVQWNPVPVVAGCGTTTTCTPASNAPTTMRWGSVTLSSGVPSTATITGLAYTSASSYVCVVTQRSTATGNLLKVANVDGTSFTITGPATVTDSINYICVGQ